MLATINTVIDQVQNAKTEFVKTCVTNDEVKKTLNTFINTQTNFTKKLAEHTWNYSMALGTLAYSFDANKAFGVKS